MRVVGRVHHSITLAKTNTTVKHKYKLDVYQVAHTDGIVQCQGVTTRTKTDLANKHLQLR